jgi:hypothetical protein
VQLSISFKYAPQLRTIWIEEKKMSEHSSRFANLKKRFLVIALIVMMLSVPIAAFSTSLASASPMAGAGLIGNTSTLLSGTTSPAPYDQGFETGPKPGLINEANWGSNQWGYKATSHSGSLAAGAAITTTGDDTRRLFVNVNFSGKSCTSITYWYKITSTDTAHRLMRLVGSNNGGNTWFVLRDWTDITSATSWTQFSASQNLSNFSNQWNCYIKIQVKNMSGHNQRTLYVDDFHIGIGGSDVLSYGPEAVFDYNSEGTNWSWIACLDLFHALIAYKDFDDDHGHVKVATITGPANNITYGPEYEFSNNASYVSVTRLDSTRVLIAYSEGGTSGGVGKAFVATVSGNTVSFGTFTNFSSTDTNSIWATSLDSTRVLIADIEKRDSGVYWGTARVVTVAGNTITNVGPETKLRTAIEKLSATALCSSKAVIAYRVFIGGNTWHAIARVATVSGTTISYGSESTFDERSTDLISVTALDSSRALIAGPVYTGGNAWPGIARVATVSGNSLQFGQPYTFNDTIGGTACVRATALGPTRTLIAYRDSNIGTGIVVAVSGNSISSYLLEKVFNPGPATTYYIWATSLDYSHALISYNDDGNNGYGTAIVAAI